MDIFTIMALNSTGNNQDGGSGTIQVSGDFENIIDYQADPTGVTGSADAILEAYSGKTDIIYIPKGVFLVEKNITLSSDKKIVFARNGRLMPAEGVTITINGTWDASEDDWIFDLSLGGSVTGNYSVDEIRPEWVGAKGDGKTDDAASFNAAMVMCAKKRVFRMGPKSYKIRATVHNNARAIRGTAMYVDSQQSGTVISWDPIDKTTDLLPCIRIASSGNNLVVEDFRIAGMISYNSQNLGKYINKEFFVQSRYEMFSAGCVAFEVTDKATPVFRHIQTSGVKVGLLMNSQNGHITSYDCVWGGLIGVYCIKNTEDYYFQGGGVSGAFCGVMFGVKLISNHHGGMSVRMDRVHMGFSPYGFYQVIDDAAVYADTTKTIGGLSLVLLSTRFERIGECAIKCLPRASAGPINIAGFGFSWSPHIFTPTSDHGWVCPLPDELMPADERQQYAVMLGTIKEGTYIDNQDAGGVSKSKAPGAVGSAYIDILTGTSHLVGLDLSNTVIRRKLPKVSTTIQPTDIENIGRYSVSSALSRGNLLLNPEIAENWHLSGGTGTISIISESEAPARISREMRAFVGEDVKIVKLVPSGAVIPTLAISFKPGHVIDVERDVCYEFFILSEDPKPACRTSIQFSGARAVYDDTHRPNSMEWTRLTGRGDKPTSASGHRVVISASLTSPIYVAAVMCNYDSPAPYSPVPHSYSKNDIEIGGNGKGLILTDSATSNRHKLTLVDGTVRAEGTELKTKIYSEDGIPYRLKVSNDGLVTTQLDAVYYNSFDEVDNDKTLGEGWITDNNSTWGIKDNEAYCTNTSGFRRANYQTNLINYAMTCSLKGVISDSANNARPGLTIKHVAADNTIWAAFTHNTLTLIRRKSSVDTVLASTPFTALDNTFYKMQVFYRNGEISVFVDGAVLITYNLNPDDFALFNSSTLAGLYQRINGAFTTSPKFDNFLIEHA